MPLTLETYARLLARLAARRSARASDILSELGVSADELREAEPVLRAQLADAWNKRQGIVAMKFATALGAELQTLGPLIGDSTAPAAPEVRETATPSYLQAPPAATLPVIAAPSFTAPPTEPAKPPAIVAKAPPQLAGTANVDLSAIIANIQGGGLPFARSEPQDEEADVSLLPLETFAAVSGALARGESREAALAKHGLTSATFDVLAKAWAQKFQREPQLLERFKELAKSSAATGRGS